MFKVNNKKVALVSFHLTLSRLHTLSMLLLLTLSITFWVHIVKSLMSETSHWYMILHFTFINKNCLKSDSSLPKICCLLHWKPFKNDEKCFWFHIKNSFFFLRYLSFCHDFLVMLKKRLDYKYKINFTNWLTNSFNTHIAQYLAK